MIISFELNYDELVSASEENLTNGIVELVRSHRLGHHVIVMDRAIASELSRRLVLTQRDRSMLERIGLQFTQLADLPRRAKCHIKIISSVGNYIMDNGHVVECSLQWLSGKNILAKPVLVIEDIVNDGEFYKFVLSQFGGVLNTPTPQFEVQHGGGSRLADVFRVRVGEHRVVCGVADRDLLSPVHAGGNTFRELERVRVEQRWPLAYVFSPFCRELENMLPLDVIREQCVGREQLDIWSEICRIADGENVRGVPAGERLCLFIDLKNGLTRAQIDGMSCQRSRDWIRERLRGVESWNDDVIIQGLGSNIVTNILRSNVALSVLRQHIRSRSWLECFEEHITDLLWIFAGGGSVIS